MLSATPSNGSLRFLGVALLLLVCARTESKPDVADAMRMSLPPAMDGNMRRVEDVFREQESGDDAIAAQAAREGGS